MICTIRITTSAHKKIGDKTYLIVGAEDHKTGHIENTNECFNKLEAYIKRHFVITEVAYKWSSQYFEPADALPYIGHLPGQENNILVATGYGGNGMTYSHIAAVTLRSILLNEDDPKIKLFNPNRIKPIAGFVSFLSHNADVVKEFASKLLGHEKLEKSADIKPGNGRVVKYEDETVALHKDENGSLHAVNPACTHMKCSVAWNEAEQTWDCPCHGARYSVDGVVVTGPANRDLEKIEVQKN